MDKEFSIERLPNRITVTYGLAVVSWSLTKELPNQTPRRIVANAAVDGMDDLLVAISIANQYY